MDSYVNKFIRKNYQIESNKIISWVIDDQYGRSIDNHKKCANIINSYINNLITKIGKENWDLLGYV